MTALLPDWGARLAKVLSAVDKASPERGGFTRANSVVALRYAIRAGLIEP